LDENEFKRLVESVDATKTEEQVDVLLEAVDPWNNQKVTFTECVECLSNELVQMSRGQ
jgi:Ca2+-binding EF-hand superfamily protein